MGSESPISRLLKKEQVVFLDEIETRDEALHRLVEVLVKQGEVKEGPSFYKAILERERLVSTGIGIGIALPHAKLPVFRHFFIAIGIHPRGIPWEALDGGLVRVIFMIGGPDDKQTEYLQLLSRLTMAIKDEERRKKMLQLRSQADIIALFEGM